MEGFEIKRLTTHDLRQAEAARELGYEIGSPGLIALAVHRSAASWTTQFFAASSPLPR